MRLRTEAVRVWTTHGEHGPDPLWGWGGAILTMSPGLSNAKNREKSPRFSGRWRH